MSSSDTKYVAEMRAPAATSTELLVDTPLPEVKREVKKAADVCAAGEFVLTSQVTLLHVRPRLPVDCVEDMRKLLQGFTVPDTVTTGTGVTGLPALDTLTSCAVLFRKKGQSDIDCSKEQLAFSLLLSKATPSPGKIVDVLNKRTATVVVFSH